MSAIAYEERHAIRDALPALGKLAALLFIVGCLYVIDYFVRALFGSVSSAVGWIPYAGKILAAPVHKIEQKVSHSLGTAERTIDQHIATSFHKLAKIIRALPRELAMQAAMVAVIAVALGRLVPWGDFLRMLRRAVVPLQLQNKAQNRAIHNTATHATTATHTATHADKGATIVAAQAASLSSRFWRTRVNSRLRREELSLARVWKWIRSRPTSYTTAAFIAASAWALTKLGGGWIRCSNWRRLGRAVCGLPASTITSLLGLLALSFALSDIRRTAEFAESIADEVARDLVRAVHGGDLPTGTFTID